MRALKTARQRIGAYFDGWVTPWPFVIFRIGLGIIVLVRTSDWLRPLIDLDHHGWVTGLEYAPWNDSITEPALYSPLIPGLPALGSEFTAVLVIARTALAVLLILGWRPPLCAATLALVGYLLMAGDRYRYLHHLHLLWWSCGLFALVPCTPSIFASLGTALGRWRSKLASQKLSSTTRVPRWPMQILRFQALVVYAAAGWAKLDAAWLDGSVLDGLAAHHLVTGSSWQTMHALVGSSGVAIAACASELALVPLLAWRRTRLAGIAIAALLHATISASMMVATFGSQMALYFVFFLPWTDADRRDGRPPLPRPVTGRPESR